jgi:hypothetical protein
MTEGQGRALTWIEGNLWAIMCAIATGGSGVLIGMTTSSHRLDEAEKDIAEIRADMKDLGPRLDRLEVAVQMEREQRLKGDSE